MRRPPPSSASSHSLLLAASSSPSVPIADAHAQYQQRHVPSIPKSKSITITSGPHNNNPTHNQLANVHKNASTNNNNNNKKTSLFGLSRANRGQRVSKGETHEEEPDMNDMVHARYQQQQQQQHRHNNTSTSSSSSSTLLNGGSKFHSYILNTPSSSQQASVAAAAAAAHIAGYHQQQQQQHSVDTSNSSLNKSFTTIAHDEHDVHIRMLIFVENSQGTRFKLFDSARPPFSAAAAAAAAGHKSAPSSATPATATAASQIPASKSSQKPQSAAASPLNATAATSTTEPKLSTEMITRMVFGSFPMVVNRTAIKVHSLK